MSYLTSPHLTSPYLTSPHLTLPYLILPYLTLSHLFWKLAWSERIDLHTWSKATKWSIISTQMAAEPVGAIRWQCNQNLLRVILELQIAQVKQLLLCKLSRHYKQYYWMGLSRYTKWCKYENEIFRWRTFINNFFVVILRVTISINVHFYIYIYIYIICVLNMDLRLILIAISWLLSSLRKLT